MISIRKLAALLAMASGVAFASGSEGFSTGPNNAARLYNTGKLVYADKFSCSGCPMAAKTLNAEVAREVLAGKTKVTLSGDEQAAVEAYLKRRFKL
jgi:hypothetical protein